jgi:hypothetical protein
VEVVPGLLRAATKTKDEKLRLATLNALSRVLKHTSAEAAVKLVGEPSFTVTLRQEMEGLSRSGRMAAGFVLFFLLSP